MIPIRSLGFKLPSFFSSSSSSSKAIHIPSVEIHDVETDKRETKRPARRLDQYLRSNHLNHSIIYHNLTYHNHLPHILGSAYLLGADRDKLGEIYDVESKDLEPWKEAPGEISKEDWLDFLGKREYQRAWVDFFDDRRVDLGYSWKDLLNEYLFEGPRPLVYNLLCSLAHPVIHLGYAYELSHEYVAIEALALTTSFYDDQHKYHDDPSYTKPAPNPSTDLLEILSRVAKDSRFEKVTGSEEDVLSLFSKPDDEALMLEYWNTWELTDPKKQFEDSQKAAAAMLVGTPDKKSPDYDFFLVHVLTSSHAVRILLPLFEGKWHKMLVRQWWFFALSAYVLQGRPAIDLDRVKNYDIQGRDWDFVVARALTSKWSTDAHFVKACRAFKVAAETWGDADGFYLKAAVRFADEFDSWAH